MTAYLIDCNAKQLYERLCELGLGKDEWNKYAGYYEEYAYNGRYFSINSEGDILIAGHVRGRFVTRGSTLLGSLAKRWHR